ncbi:MAG TPA: carboxypeptidase-like regulatory domain-containing protein [Methylomirabilota bacterium]|nr:carboxypeptidase-like regulatory domain-containing protein [Methylomirabilota bacterium]
MTHTRLVAALTLVLALSILVAFVPPAAAQTVIAGTVKSKDGKPLPGLALLEKGEIHNNVWDRGALVDARGHFRIEVGSAGQYGLHVYSTGYLYAPQAVKVEAGKPLELQIVLVPEPTRANTPIIRKVGFFPWEARQGKVTFVKADVTDPNNDLGPQVLTFNAATGRAYAMEPPQKVRDLKANFPNGVYQLAVDTPTAPINPRDWHFVVADHQCNTSDILSFPHEPKPQQVIR